MGVAVFGGSFDPVHIGHLHVADSALRVPWVNTVYCVPAGRPPHKTLSGGAGADQRLTMLEESVASRPGVEVLDWEIHSTGVTYTYPTIQRIQKELSGGAPIGMIIGTDLLAAFTAWKNWEDILSRVTLLLTRHPDGGDPRTVLQSETASSFPMCLRRAIERSEIVDHLPLPISSRSVRSRIARSLSYRDLVPPAAFKLIDGQRLYRS